MIDKTIASNRYLYANDDGTIEFSVTRTKLTPDEAEEWAGDLLAVAAEAREMKPKRRLTVVE